MELLQLGQMEKGSVRTDHKVKSIRDRWFSQKHRSDNNTSESKEGRIEDGVYIKRDSLIQLKCKRGKSHESIEYYRVLGFFFKYYNKWYMSLDNKFLWSADKTQMKNARVMGRLMEQSGAAFKEVKLEKDGANGPQHVYCIKNINEIEGVPLELDNLF